MLSEFKKTDYKSLVVVDGLIKTGIAGKIWRKDDPWLSIFWVCAEKRYCYVTSMRRGNSSSFLFECLEF